MKILPNTIINFHAVHDAVWMDKVLRLLKKLYHPVSILDIKTFYHDRKPLRNTCHITFDDGDKSFYTTVFPLLKKFNFPASIYISPKITLDGGNFWFQEIRGYDQERIRDIIGVYLDKNYDEIRSVPVDALMRNFTINKMWMIIRDYQKKTNTPPKADMNMSLANIHELHKSGLVAIGAHTMNHPILKNETDEIAYSEINNSINQLSSLLQSQVHYFAYPNGIPGIDFSEREVNILRGTEVKIALSTENKALCYQDNPLIIPRNSISKGGNFFIFSKLFAGKHWQFLRRVSKGTDESNFRFISN
jgi:peptidoglycan/xylan/chitin deacetylase (PgdA/CDA1 family)